MATDSPANEHRDGDWPSKRVTLNDIAQAVGVSRTTVSLALANHKRISEQRRKQIKQTALEMGYRPDPHLAALAQYRKKSRSAPPKATIAWLNFWKEPQRLRCYHEFDLYWQGAFQVANRAGYKLEEFTLSELLPKRLAGILEARGIEGALLPPYPNAVEQNVLQFPFSKFKVIRFGWNFQKPYLHSVTSDLIASAEVAFQEILSKGYQRIGYAAIKEKKRPFGAGIFWAQQCWESLPALRELFIEANLSSQEKLAQLSDWLKQEKPEAILTDLHELPTWLNMLGVHVPNDIALATLSPHDTPIDAGIDQNPFEIGRTAAYALICRLSVWNDETPSGIKTQTLVPARWIDGTSLPTKTTSCVL